jgi:succinate dehydrogenase / fumarate reductase, membrane anchor subunit
MRLSGLALVVLALGHMFIMHVLVMLTGAEVNFAFVQSRWGTPFWRIYDFALLVLAFVHGARGARTAIVLRAACSSVHCFFSAASGWRLESR